jgi:hypothetical protein
LNSNVNDWKKEIETMEKEIHNKREILNKERILLTDELILDREEDLLIEERKSISTNMIDLGLMVILFYKKNNLYNQFKTKYLLLSKK